MSAAALLEWKANVEAAVRGIAHSLNNRAAALSALLELSRDAGDDDPDATRSILSGELLRVTELARLIRTLGPTRPGVEAFTPQDAAAESLAVLQLHIEPGERAIAIDASHAPPVRVERWMFVRALVAMGAAVTNGDVAMGRGDASARIVIDADGDWLVARAEGITASTATLSPLTAELAQAMGGEPLETQFGFRLPSLAALRQREAR